MPNCPNDPIMTNRTAASLVAVACLAFCLIFGSSNMGRAGPLQDAAKEGDADKIEQLVDQGADVNEKGLAIALHYAVRGGHVRSCRTSDHKGS